MRETKRLNDELSAYRRTTNERGTDTYAAAAGSHDDLVLALQPRPGPQNTVDPRAPNLDTAASPGAASPPPKKPPLAATAGSSASRPAAQTYPASPPPSDCRSSERPPDRASLLVPSLPLPQLTACYPGDTVAALPRARILPLGPAFPERPEVAELSPVLVRCVVE